MQTHIHPKFAQIPAIKEAEDVLRSCVHCGFCNATCPTYLQLGDERDGPRGRIYLLKQFLESGTASEKTQQHLDRCLTCRSCETHCPSGVEYTRLADFGRKLLEKEVGRPRHQRLIRKVIRLIVPFPRRFGLLLKLGQMIRPLLPNRLAGRIPQSQNSGSPPKQIHTRKVVMLAGCVQASATPNTNAAASRVLDRLGITTLQPAGSGCCGAVSHHLSCEAEARQFIRRNIDAWRLALQDGTESIVVTASGCGMMLKDYGKIMQDDPDYAADAQRISNLTQDLSEFLAKEDIASLKIKDPSRTSLHCPCTLTHGLGASHTLRQLLQRCGVTLASTKDDHLCCGSAGTFSILQADMSQQLLEKKIQALSIDQPERIVTANVGCQLHLASRAPIPVLHWIELLDQ